MTKNDFEQIDQSFRQLKIAGAIAVVLILTMLVVAVILDLRTETFEKEARYRPPSDRTEEKPTAADRMELQRIKPVQGQTVYVPAYSHIYQDNGQPTLLTITLSIRNTSPDQELIVKSVRYFNTDGKQLKTYLAEPLPLAPMASTEFLVEGGDTSGGVGANFLVQWISEVEVSEPIIEAIMINADRQRGISFAREGKVIAELSSSSAGEFQTQSP